MARVRPRPPSPLATCLLTAGIPSVFDLGVDKSISHVRHPDVYGEILFVSHNPRNPNGSTGFRAETCGGGGKLYIRTGTLRMVCSLRLLISESADQCHDRVWCPRDYEQATDRDGGFCDPHFRRLSVRVLIASQRFHVHLFRL